MKINNLTSDRIHKTPKSLIHEMTQLSKEIDDVAFLSWAKPSTTTPEYIKDKAISAIKRGIVDGYSEEAGIPPLRKEIVKKLMRDNNIKATESQVVVTAGAIEGLSAAIMAVVDPGDEVILPSPTYSTHIRQVLVACGKPVFVPTIEEQGFRPDTEGIKNAVTKKTKAILYCTPSNPTGAIFSEADQRQIARIAAENDLVVISDEAYEYFTYDGKKHFSIGSIPEMKNRTISCYTFTKTYAMTGWRIGYLHAGDDLIPDILKAHIPLIICPPVVSQYAALAALKGPQNYVDKFREHYLKARNLMCQRLEKLSNIFTFQKPEGSYLMFPKILIGEGMDSNKFCKKLLKEVKVSTTPGIAFGPSGEGHLRMSFCVTQEMINKAFDRLEQYFK